MRPVLLCRLRRPLSLSSYRQPGLRAGALPPDGDKPGRPRWRGCHLGRRGRALRSIARAAWQPTVLTPSCCAEPGNRLSLRAPRWPAAAARFFRADLRRPGLQWARASGFCPRRVHAQVGASAAIARPTVAAPPYRQPRPPAQTVTAARMVRGGQRRLCCAIAGPDGRQGQRRRLPQPKDRARGLRRADSRFDHNRSTRFAIDGTMRGRAPVAATANRPF